MELGYRGTGEPLKREEFDARQRAADAARQTSQWHESELFSAGKDLSHSPFLSALARREHLNRCSSLATIIFIRLCMGSAKHEVSAYIDYAARLRSENSAEAYFNGSKIMLPRSTDLSYYNWDTQTCLSTSSANWNVIADGEAGLQFRNKRDRKLVIPDFGIPQIPKGTDSESALHPQPQSKLQDLPVVSSMSVETKKKCSAKKSVQQPVASVPANMLIPITGETTTVLSDDTIRIEMRSSEYIQIVFYDHYTRRKI